MKRFVFGFSVLTISVVILLTINICIGSVSIPLKEVMSILARQDNQSINSDIVMQIRFPRTLAALILGGGLALSGYMLQNFFHNPIAGPFVLGISSGA